VRKTKVEGVIEYGDRLIFVETPEKQKIVTSYEGELILKALSHGEASGKLSVHSRFHVPLGATLMVTDGAKVARDGVLFTWDPYTNPIMTDVGVWCGSWTSSKTRRCAKSWTSSPDGASG